MSTLTLSGDTLVYAPTPGERNDLTINGFTFTDRLAVINAPGMPGDGTHSVTAPPAGSISATVDGSVNLQAGTVPVALSASGTPTNPSFITTNILLCGNKFGTWSMRDILGDVSVTTTDPAAVAVASNYASNGFPGAGFDSNVVIGDGSITGMTAGALSVSGPFQKVRVIGANWPGIPENFTVSSPAFNLQIDGDAGADSVSINGVAAGFAVTVNGGAGDDAVTVNSDNLAGALAVDTGTGANTLIVQAANPQDVVIAQVNVDSWKVTGDFSGTFTYRSTGGTVTVSVI